MSYPKISLAKIHRRAGPGHYDIDVMTFSGLTTSKMLHFVDADHRSIGRDAGGTFHYNH
jgi:hypothetical protein